MNLGQLVDTVAQGLDEVPSSLRDKLLPPVPTIELLSMRDAAFSGAARFWSATGDRAASVGNFSYIGVRAGTRRVVVDGVILSVPVAGLLAMVLTGDSGISPTAVVTITSKPNQPGGVVGIAATRLLSADSASGAIGQVFFQVRLPANGAFHVPLHVRLAAGATTGAATNVQDLLVRGGSNNFALTATFYGREFED